MFDVAGSLGEALGRAQSELRDAAQRTARSQTPLGGSRSDAAMAAVAEHAVFSEVLLGAVHARLAEIKSVTRG